MAHPQQLSVLSPVYPRIWGAVGNPTQGRDQPLEGFGPSSADGSASGPREDSLTAGQKRWLRELCSSPALLARFDRLLNAELVLDLAVVGVANPSMLDQCEKDLMAGIRQAEKKEH